MDNDQIQRFAEGQTIPYIVKRQKTEVETTMFVGPYGTWGVPGDEYSYEIIWPADPKADSAFKKSPRSLKASAHTWREWRKPENTDKEVWGAPRFYPTCYLLKHNDPKDCLSWLVEGPSVPFSDPSFFEDHLSKLATAWENPCLVTRTDQVGLEYHTLVYPAEHGEPPMIVPMPPEEAERWKNGYRHVSVFRPTVLPDPEPKHVSPSNGGFVLGPHRAIRVGEIPHPFNPFVGTRLELAEDRAVERDLTAISWTYPQAEEEPGMLCDNEWVRRFAQANSIPRLVEIEGVQPYLLWPAHAGRSIPAQMDISMSEAAAWKAGRSVVSPLGNRVHKTPALYRPHHRNAINRAKQKQRSGTNIERCFDPYYFIENIGRLSYVWENPCLVKRRHYVTDREEYTLVYAGCRGCPPSKVALDEDQGREWAAQHAPGQPRGEFPRVFPDDPKRAYEWEKCVELMALNPYDPKSWEIWKRKNGIVDKKEAIRRAVDQHQGLQAAALGPWACPYPGYLHTEIRKRNIPDSPEITEPKHSRSVILGHERKSGRAPVTEKGKSVNRYQLGGGLETMDVIEAFGWSAGFAGGNVLKYLSRAIFHHREGGEDALDTDALLDLQGAERVHFIEHKDPLMVRYSRMAHALKAKRKKNAIDKANIDLDKMQHYFDMLRNIINGHGWDGGSDFHNLDELDD